ncbi:hypothetical protein D3C81_1801990 [compost metagenome]
MAKKYGLAKQKTYVSVTTISNPIASADNGNPCSWQIVAEATTTPPPLLTL